MKLTTALFLTLAASASAFAPLKIARPATATQSFQKTPSSSALFETKISTASILQELSDLEKAVEDAAPRKSDGTKVKGQDSPLTLAQVESLVSILEKVVAVEKAAGSATELFDIFVGGETDSQAGQQVSRKKVTDETEDTLDGAASTPKLFGFLDNSLTRKPAKEDPPASTPAATPEKESKSFFESILGLLKTLLELANPGDFDFATYPVHKEYPTESLASMMKMLPNPPTKPPPFEYIFSARKIIRVVRRALRFEAGLRFAEETRVKKASTAEEFYEAWFSPKRILGGLVNNPFNLVPKPQRLIKDWQKDREMARQYLAGVNPVMIQVCKDPKTQLNKDVLQFFADQNIDIETMASEKRLLFADYSDLAELEKNPHNAYPIEYNPDVKFDPANLRYYHASQIVFELERTRENMDILAIELDLVHDAKDPSKRDPQIYSSYTSSKTDWLMAKSCISNADSQFHEWISHLGNTHLTFEAHILAIHNTLRKNEHPLWDFFEPLTRDTLLLNWAARQTLAEFGAESFGDVQCCVGTGQFMQMIRNRWEKYGFFKYSAYDEELEMRGFDADFEFPGYLYREDGKKIWEAIGEFTTDFVSEVFPSDESVANDAVVQAWAKETTDADKAAVPGFPKTITDKKTLSKVMQTLWWICSGYHAVVNMPQYDYFAYMPNNPFSFRASMTQYLSEADGKREWIFENAMPDYKTTRSFMSTVRILSIPSEHCIDNLLDHYTDVKYGLKSYEKFLTKLDVIGDEIEARNKMNKKLGRAVYPYLHPTRIPSSIDI